jgi:hypothetical protein
MDQQLLEEAYDEVIKKMMTGANNPGWKLKQGLTGGGAFKPWEPAGGWPKKKETAAKKTTSAPKKVEPQEEEEFDVEGDPVGNYQSIAAPPPEEDPTASMMYVSNADLEKIYHSNEQMWERLFKDADAAVEQDGGIVFRYVAPQLKQRMQQEIESILK